MTLKSSFGTLFISAVLSTLLILSNLVFTPMIEKNRRARIEAILSRLAGKKTILAEEFNLSTLTAGQLIDLGSDDDTSIANREAEPFTGPEKALFFRGMGFWGLIEGFMKIRYSSQQNPERLEIRKIEILSHNETTGIGSRALSQIELKHFQGTRLSAGNGSALKVHTVTGATVTSSRLRAILNRALDCTPKLSDGTCEKQWGIIEDNP